jgi:hypothetical protein
MDIHTDFGENGNCHLLKNGMQLRPLDLGKKMAFLIQKKETGNLNQ